MEITPATNSAVTALARHVQAVTEMQTAVMKQIAESQQQLADMLAALGIGQNIDIQA